MTLRLPRTLPTLRTVTGRFTLSPFGPNDVQDLAHILANDDVWAAGFADGLLRPASHEEMVRFINQRYSGLRIFSVHYTRLPGGPLFVGTTGITESHPPTERVKIGRTLVSPAFWGMRVNHEVKLALLDWVFSCGAGRVECDVNPTNHRSISSLKRFGFTVEGTRRRSSQRVDGSWRNVVVLSLLREEWPVTKQVALLSFSAQRTSERSL